MLAQEELAECDQPGKNTSPKPGIGPGPRRGWIGEHENMIEIQTASNGLSAGYEILGTVCESDQQFAVEC